MMMGPMKKKVVTTGIIAFLIPCIIFGVIFYLYASKKATQVEDLKEQSKIVYRYVVSGDKEINHILTSDDITIAEVKEVSAPEDSFVYEEGNITLPGRDDKWDIIGQRLRIPAHDKTILTSGMFFEEKDYAAHDSRLKEFTTISLPSDLKEYDYVDIRILFPTGEDYLVVSGKEVKRLGQNVNSNSIFLELNEEEIIRLSSAIVESYVSDAINVYAVKYLSTEQLFDRKNVNYVERYKNTVEAMLDELQKNDVIANEGASQTDEVTNNIVHTEDELSIEEIASKINLSVEDTKTLKKALGTEDKDVIAYYEDKLETIEKPLIPDYPVRPEVAKVVMNDMNIVEELKTKYNVESLEAQRAGLLNTSIKKPDEYTGELKESDEILEKFAENLKTEIDAQKTERKEYLQSLIRNSVAVDAEEQ